MTHVIPRLCLFVSGMVLLSGCGGQQSPRVVRTAESSFDEAQQALEAGDFAAAEKHFSESLAARGLQSDRIEAAHLGRAKAYVGLDQLVDAEADLMFLEQNAADLSPVHLTRAEMLLKKGDKSGAKAAFAEARKLNPKLKPPAGL